MGDVDYGFVGAGNNKVNLYKGLKPIKRHIPYVIGMEEGIHDRSVLAFSTGFYKAIGAGRDIPFAFELGVTTIKLEGIDDDSLPILL